MTATPERRQPWARVCILAVACLILTGCTGPQSGLDPAGHGATRVAELFWWMTGGALLVWAAVIWVTVSAIRGRVARQNHRQALFYIVGGGAVVPTVVLTGLLVYGLGMMPEMLAPAPEGSLRISVSGEQWWWRVRYHNPNGDAVELANEIRLPVNEPVEFVLDSPDVIHSFWIPSLGGKMDMIPGRETRLVLHPTRTGTFRGQCAEFCGASHALMAFAVVVMERPDFDRWLAGQQADGSEPEGPPDSPVAEGRRLFFAAGCAACHTIRGTPAGGKIGPDLTHVGGRLTLGAGIVANEHSGFMRWLEQTDKVKPGVHMPQFGMLPNEELKALSAYLESLQ